MCKIRWTVLWTTLCLVTVGVAAGAFDAETWLVEEYLGVGTTLPLYPADIAGYVRAHSLRLESVLPQLRWYDTDGDDPLDYCKQVYNSGQYSLVWRDDSKGITTALLAADCDDSRIGIATTSPLYTLDVSGDGRFAGPVTIGAYEFPTNDGAAGQVLTTNGLGTLAWATVAGNGITYWASIGRDIYATGTGNVGIGTLTPRQMLDVAGSIAMTGSLYVGSTRFLYPHGNSSTFLGLNAGNRSMEGGWNTAVGAFALESNALGSRNAALGDRALRVNASGSQNTAMGNEALRSCRVGSDNVAIGCRALANSTGNRNIAIGSDAGTNLTNGSGNIYIVATGQATESDTIRIGNDSHTQAYITGIHGVAISNGSPISVGPDGQLGTTLSSARFKTEIAELGSTSNVLYDLRPVSFRYKPDLDPVGVTQYGLIAEEVAEVAPDLVIADEDGEPYTVRYEQLVPLLVNEVQELRANQSELLGRLDALEAELATRR